MDCLKNNILEQVYIILKGQGTNLLMPLKKKRKKGEAHTHYAAKDDLTS